MAAQPQAMIGQCDALPAPDVENTPMRWIRIETDTETRWINLEQVSRATLARHAGSGTEILVMFFANQDEECTLKIEATSKKHSAAIKALTAALDASAK
jgi:hypothetical protein